MVEEVKDETAVDSRYVSLQLSYGNLHFFSRDNVTKDTLDTLCGLDLSNQRTLPTAITVVFKKGFGFSGNTQVYLEPLVEQIFVKNIVSLEKGYMFINNEDDE